MADIRFRMERDYNESDPRPPSDDKVLVLAGIVIAFVFFFIMAVIAAAVK